MLVILGLAFWLADRKAEKLFWKHVADSLGYQPFYDPTALETTTPLLHAGDRRFWKHELMGPLGDSGLSARLAQYRYEVRKENSEGRGVVGQLPLHDLPRRARRRDGSCSRASTCASSRGLLGSLGSTTGCAAAG